MARALTLFDRWLVALGSCTGDDPQDDGTAEILRSVAERYPSRVLLEEAPNGWGSPLNAYRAVLASARGELTEAVHLYLLPAGEVWDYQQLTAAEEALRHHGLQSARFPFDCRVGGDLFIRSGWEAAPQARLWRWHGQLPSHDEPLEFSGLSVAKTIDVRPLRHILQTSEEVRRYEQRHGYGGLLERWVRLQAAAPDTFPRPLTDLLGPSGRIFTETQLFHDEQPTPVPLP